MPQSPFKHRPPKSWRRLTIQTVPEIADHVAGYIAAFSQNGLEQIDGDATSTIIMYLESGTPVTEKNEVQLKKYLSQLPTIFKGQPQPELQIETIEEKDWDKKWKESFKPFHLTPRLVVKPTWETYAPKNNETVIELDPGMAFGTGLHASTRLALELIDHSYSQDQTFFKEVLDVGTGTGILAMAAALFGGEKILAIDNDPDAVVAAEDNIKQNGLENKVRADGIDLAEVPDQYNMVIANIIHDVLIELAEKLLDHLKPGGVLILSGILAGKQAANIKNVFTHSGLTLGETKNSGEWEAMSFSKPTVSQ